MIYVTSDLHGYPLDKFLALLSSANFGEDDFLFVLGDVIDRGTDGAALLRWMVQQPNVELILGNHEAMLLSCSFLFDSLTEENAAELGSQKLRLLSAWIGNGASPTLTGLRPILKREPDVFDGIMEYLREAPLYDIVEVGGREFILVHAGLGNFHPDKPLETYSAEEMIWARPTMDTRYFEDATVIFGHTPTQHLIGGELGGKMVQTDSWICIDTGAACGNKPMLLRLDDMQAFYE
ncbi:MAG: serine/threonine protein phosphatase [Ruminococcaceae bacterium]|nr:serine/threonine protein phosphatase [Oscillospiraceae bacterium]